MPEHRGARPLWQTDCSQVGFHSGPGDGGGRDVGTSSPSQEGTHGPASGGETNHPGFLLLAPPALPEGPFANQMFLILQEAQQGANLSLIFEARSLIQYLFI